jgi:hypothetical protein
MKSNIIYHTIKHEISCDHQHNLNTKICPCHDTPVCIYCYEDHIIKSKNSCSEKIQEIQNMMDIQKNFMSKFKDEIATENDEIKKRKIVQYYERVKDDYHNSKKELEEEINRYDKIKGCKKIIPQ